MDDDSFHRYTEISSLIVENDYRLLYLPPYSPFLNPIKNMFGKLKENIRRSRPSNETELFLLIENVN